MHTITILSPTRERHLAPRKENPLFAGDTFGHGDCVKRNDAGAIASGIMDYRYLERFSALLNPCVANEVLSKPPSDRQQSFQFPKRLFK